MELKWFICGTANINAEMFRYSVQEYSEIYSSSQKFEHTHYLMKLSIHALEVKSTIDQLLNLFYVKVFNNFNVQRQNMEAKQVILNVSWY